MISGQRHRQVWLTVLLVTVGLGCIVAIDWRYWNADAAGPGRWPYLLSSLFGVAFAGGITWAVRIAASAGLQKEALGFGDVTLMAMIGAYLGWQPSLMVFFLAPLVAILFVLIRVVLTGDMSTPYGPYLCAAAALVLVFWNSLWNGWAAPLFNLGTIVLGIVVACVVLMGAMLWTWRLIKEFALQAMASRR